MHVTISIIYFNSCELGTFIAWKLLLRTFSDIHFNWSHISTRYLYVLLKCDTISQSEMQRWRVALQHMAGSMWTAEHLLPLFWFQSFHGRWNLLLRFDRVQTRLPHFAHIWLRVQITWCWKVKSRLPISSKANRENDSLVELDCCTGTMVRVGSHFTLLISSYPKSEQTFRFLQVFLLLENHHKSCGRIFFRPSGQKESDDPRNVGKHSISH